MVIQYLDTKKDPFGPQEDNEKFLCPEVPYLSAIGTQMYLANNTRPNNAFYVNLLVRYIKHALRYLQGTIDLGLFYSNKSNNCNLSSVKRIPTILYGDNAAYIAQLKGGYIKGDTTKHILPKFFFTHQVQRNGEIDVQQVRSCDNLADLFCKVLSIATFKKLICKIGMC
ncbi:hypothetical protein M9H77_36346 [Catharanthus roseus]|uniref:Uncharacterized protein n=1 Tax=Catharanthus roseus TaxID=4058 RepID=A0ACB9ZSU7_CATRO|nr:hypothetical protein M9H77_36346 [Catharanthus roseus]